MTGQQTICLIMKRIVLLCISLLFFVVQYAFAEECKVVGVTDGDTTKALCSGEMIKVKLCGIDSPEESQPFGQNSPPTIGRSPQFWPLSGPTNPRGNPEKILVYPVLGGLAHVKFYL